MDYEIFLYVLLKIAPELRPVLLILPLGAADPPILAY
jgi:hypothetical protein